MLLKQQIMETFLSLFIFGDQLLELFLLLLHQTTWPKHEEEKTSTDINNKNINWTSNFIS
jgi:hypothetical protein